MLESCLAGSDGFFSGNRSGNVTNHRHIVGAGRVQLNQLVPGDYALQVIVTDKLASEKYRVAAQTGNLRELPKLIEAAGQAITELQQQLSKAKTAWDFDEDTYLSNGAFIAELLATAQQTGVSMYERDDRLYCYPALIRVLPNDRAVVIDKARERRLRRRTHRQLRLLHAVPEPGADDDQHRAPRAGLPVAGGLDLGTRARLQQPAGAGDQ